MEATKRKLIIKPQLEENKTKSGLYLCRKDNKKYNVADVVSIGSSCDFNDLKAGDTIIYDKFSVFGFYEDDILYYSLLSSGVFAKIIESGLIPYNRQIIIKQDEAPKITKSGIIINIHDTLDKKPNRGTIIFASHDVEDLKVGDRIIFTKYSGRNLLYKDQHYIIMLDNEPLMLILDGDGSNVDTGETFNYEEVAHGLNFPDNV